MCFFFNDTATTEIYTLSLHDALPISRGRSSTSAPSSPTPASSSTTTCPVSRLAPSSSASATSGSTFARLKGGPTFRRRSRSEEHTSELQSRQYLVCRLLLEKKKID